MEGYRVRSSAERAGGGSGSWSDILEGDDVVAGLHVGNTLADGLDETSALVAKHDGEGALGILARECVGV
jgi:hypothetical protein